jgi:hypothetical protein
MDLILSYLAAVTLFVAIRAESGSPNFFSKNIAGHQFVNPDWRRFSPTKAVNKYQ